MFLKGKSSSQPTAALYINRPEPSVHGTVTVAACADSADINQLFLTNNHPVLVGIQPIARYEVDIGKTHRHIA